MRNFHCIARGIQVEPIVGALARQPELWGQNPWRTLYKGTPHGDVDDILLRYSRVEEQDLEDLSKVQNDLAPVWYPAIASLPQIKPLVLNLMRQVDAFGLERLLITRLKPGGKILPHADTSGAYVNTGDIGRYHVVLQGLPGCLFKCGTETVQMLTGEAWWFEAHEVHEVINRSADDRVHLICDVRYWDQSVRGAGK